MEEYKRFITIRVTPEQYKVIEDRAWQARRTRSEYLRGAINALKTSPEFRRELERHMEAKK